MKFRSEGIKFLLAARDNLMRENDILDKSLEEAYVTDLIQTLIKMGSKIKALEVSEPWIEIDNKNDLESGVTKSRVEQIISELYKITGSR